MLKIVKAEPRSDRRPGSLPKLRPTPYPSHSAPPLSRSGPPSTIPPLPSEILALIIEHIKTGGYSERKGYAVDTVDPAAERRTLLACCLTSKTLLPYARKELYHSIDVLESPSWFDFLCLSLLVAPHLAGLVRRAHVKRQSERKPVARFAPDDYSTVLNMGMILRCCPNVQDLQLDLREVGLGEVVPLIRQAHRESMRLKSLMVELPLWDGPTTAAYTTNMSAALCSLLRGQPTLKSLVLVFDGVFTWEGDAPTFELYDLEVAMVAQSTDFETLSGSSRTSLRVLTIGDYDDDSEPDWLQFPNLHTLRTMRVPLRPHLAYPQLRKLPLRHFHLVPDTDLPPGFDPLPHLPASLTTITHSFSNPTDLIAYLGSNVCPALARALFNADAGLSPWSEMRWRGPLARTDSSSCSLSQWSCLIMSRKRAARLEARGSYAWRSCGGASIEQVPRRGARWVVVSLRGFEF